MAWSIHYTSAEERCRYLDGYARRLGEIGTLKPMFFHPLGHFGDDWRLRAHVKPLTVGQRRIPEPDE